MVGPLPGLAIRLTAVLQLAQQKPDQLLAHREALPAQRRHEVALAAAHPAQRRLRIAADRVLDQGFQGRHQSRLTLHSPLAPSAGTTHPIPKLVASRLQLGNAPIDRAPRNARRRSHRRHPAIPQRNRLVPRKQPTPPLVEEWLDPRKPSLKVRNIDHLSNISLCCLPTYQYLDSILALLGHTRFDNFATDP